MPSHPLFATFRNKSLVLANRIVMAPMTRAKSPGGVPTDAVAAYYRRRVEGGVGLIITEGTTIDRPGASNDADIPDFHTPASLAAWAHVVREVHAAGGKIAPQLWHMGVDIFHCSTRRFWEPEFKSSTLNLAGWTRKMTGKPAITVGSVGLAGSDFIGAFNGEGAAVSDLGELERRLHRQEFDLVAVGRALIADPDWPAKVQRGDLSAIVPFDPAALASL